MFSGNNDKKHDKIVMLGRSELNKNETLISKALVDHSRSVTKIIPQLLMKKRSVEVLKSQRRDVERDKLIEKSKKKMDR